MDPLTLTVSTTACRGVDTSRRQAKTGWPAFGSSPVAAVLLPNETNLPSDVAISSQRVHGRDQLRVAHGVPGGPRRDRQHALAAALTITNGLAILILGPLSRGISRATAWAPVMLLYNYGFVSQTRFILRPRGRPSLRPAWLSRSSPTAAGRAGARHLPLHRGRRRNARRPSAPGAGASEAPSGALITARRPTRAREGPVEPAPVNILPASISARLRHRRTAGLANKYPSVSVLFADLVGVHAALGAALAGRGESGTSSAASSRDFDALVAEHGYRRRSRRSAMPTWPRGGLARAAGPITPRASSIWAWQ